MGCRRKEMVVGIKKVIMELLQKGYSQRKISDMLNIPKCLPVIFWHGIRWKQTKEQTA